LADLKMLAPVEGDDPCGSDLKWDMDFMTVMQQFDILIMQDRGGVVSGESAAEIGAPEFGELVGKIERLSERTRDMRLLAVRAEALWRGAGLGDFASALEELVAVAEKWPDPKTGVHPRADDLDGDLGERTAALRKMLNNIPTLAHTAGWGTDPTFEERQAATAALKRVFDSWNDRLEPAFADDLPYAIDAWNAIRQLFPATGSGVETGEGSEATATTDASAHADAWDLIERAEEALAIQDRHSPALPVLQLLLIWRSKGILQIAEGMKMSGMTMEQFLDSLRQQLEAG